MDKNTSWTLGDHCQLQDRALRETGCLISGVIRVMSVFSVYVLTVCGRDFMLLLYLFLTFSFQKRKRNTFEL